MTRFASFLRTSVDVVDVDEVGIGVESSVIVIISARLHRIVARRPNAFL